MRSCTSLNLHQQSYPTPQLLLSLISFILLHFPFYQHLQYYHPHYYYCLSLEPTILLIHYFSIIPTIFQFQFKLDHLLPLFTQRQSSSIQIQQIISFFLFSQQVILRNAIIHLIILTILVSFYQFHPQKNNVLC